MSTSTGRPIGDNDPVMLRTAAELAFPDGSMTEVGLRKMRDRGLLVVERIAGRDYTTLAEIQAMRERCRAASKARAAVAQRRNDPQADSARAQAALGATIERLRALNTPTKPRGKQARKPPPEPPKSTTRKRQLSPRLSKAPASKP